MLAVLLVVWFFALPVSVFSKAGTMIRGMQQSIQPLEKQMEWAVNMIVNRSVSGNGLYGAFAGSMSKITDAPQNPRAIFPVSIWAIRVTKYTDAKSIRCIKNE